MTATTATTQVFLLPDLGEGLTEAGLVQWLVTEGDEIVPDQVIAEVETAKSVVELPSPYGGVVRRLHGDAGDTILVGAPVIEVGGADAGDAQEVTPIAAKAAAPVAAAASPAADEGAAERVELDAHRTEELAGSGNVLIGYGTSVHGGAPRRRRAPRRTVELAAHGAVRSPIVRRLARELGVDLAAVPATGADGAVTRADVQRAADAATASAPPAAPRVPGADGLLPFASAVVVGRERLSMLRRTVSARLRRSRSEIPDATVWVDVDVTDLWALRPRMAASGERAPSFTAILARFVLLALEEYPLLATRLTDDGDALERFDGVHLGLATDTARGLVVPVVPRADLLRIDELDRELRAMAAIVRDGGLAPERLSGSTFTLNNYGAFGVDGSAAIINHPEVAILGIGRVLERAWVVQGVVQPRRVAQLSLAFDHRVCDGGYAAGFLRRVADLLESPLVAYSRV